MAKPIAHTAPEPPLLDAPEFYKARWWREHVFKGSRADLSDLVGYSEEHIANLEAGTHRATGHPMRPAAYRAYRMACAAISAGVGFNWISVSLKGEPTLPVSAAEYRERSGG